MCGLKTSVKSACRFSPASPHFGLDPEIPDLAVIKGQNGLSVGSGHDHDLNVGDARIIRPNRILPAHADTPLFLNRSDLAKKPVYGLKRSFDFDLCRKEWLEPKLLAGFRDHKLPK